MITYVTGDLFHSPAQVLVNTVNTVGVMGKGIAYEFKRIYPEMFVRYRELCEEQRFAIGDLWLYKSPNKWVLNFPTKTHWRYPSKPGYIEAGLKRFRETYSTLGIHSIAFPALGCGNGELDFRTQVQPLMEKYLRGLPIDVFVYPDHNDPYPPEHQQPEQFRKWLQTQPESLSFNQVWEDLQRVLKERREFSTASRNNTFEVTVLAEEEGIKVTASGHTYNIDREMLLAFWQQLRDYGFSMRKIAPSITREISYLIPVFLELPYVKPVRIADRFEDLQSNFSLGLQYVPGLAPVLPGAPTQLPLFEFSLNA